MEKAKVYFTKTITPEAAAAMYRALGLELPGKVAVKVHSGEAGNQNFLRPAFLRAVIEAVSGTVVECNTAYDGARNTTERHKKLMADHGWSAQFPVDILDWEGPDWALEIPNGKVMKRNLVGRDLKNYDSLLVLSHFKGHPMGGFGGALKQLSIGCASAAGKCLIHSAGVNEDPAAFWTNVAPQAQFCEAMADAAGSVAALFPGKAAYVSLMVNLSVDCDCCAVAEDPCMADIGILSSLDPVALDQACLDLIYASDDPGRAHFLERVESRMGAYTIEAAEALGFGTRQYERIDVTL